MKHVINDESVLYTMVDGKIYGPFGTSISTLSDISAAEFCGTRKVIIPSPVPGKTVSTDDRWGDLLERKITKIVSSSDGLYHEFYLDYLEEDDRDFLKEDA